MRPTKADLAALRWVGHSYVVVADHDGKAEAYAMVESEKSARKFARDRPGSRIYRRLGGKSRAWKQLRAAPFAAPATL
jgi:hypothetical protein